MVKLSTVYSILQSKWTPIHQASGWGTADVVTILIEHGAQLDVKNKVFLYFPYSNYLLCLS